VVEVSGFGKVVRMDTDGEALAGKVIKSKIIIEFQIQSGVKERFCREM